MTRNLVAVLAALFSVTVGNAGAATITWTGQGANSNWSTTANWAGGAAPANNVATDDVQLAGTVTTSNVDVPWAVKSLAFNGNALAFTLGGSTLTLGTGGLTNSAPYAVETINNSLVLGATQTFTNSSVSPAATNIISTQLMKPADTLVIAGTTLDLGANILTMAGTGATRIDAQITGTGGLTVNAGTTTLTNTNNTFSGTLTLNAATLMINNIGALGGSGNIVVGGAGTLVYNNNAAAGISRGITLNNNLVLANIGTGTLTLTGGVSAGAARTLTVRGQGNVTVDTTGLNLGAAGILEKFESGTLSVNAASTFNTINVRGGTLAITAAVTQTNGVVTVGWFGGNEAAITLANTAAVLRLSGGGTLSTTGAYNLQGGASLILDNTSLDNGNRIGAGAITMRGSTLSLIGRNDGTTNTAESVGTVTLAGNYVTLSPLFGGNGNVIAVDRNGAASVTLTLGGVTTRQAGVNFGTTVDYQGAEALGTTSRILFNGGSNNAFIGAWATATNGTSTDFAEYDTTAGVRQLTSARAGAFSNTAADNVLTTGNVQLTAATYNVNSGKLGGDLDVNGNQLTLATGGLIASTGVSSISDSAAGAGTGLRSGGQEFFLYTPAGATTTLTAKVLEGGVAGSVFTKTGAGTLVYNAFGSTYTGATIVNGGTLQAGAANALPTGTTLIANDTGTFDLNGFDVQVADILGHGTINLTANRTLTVTNNTGTNTTAKTTAFTGNLTGTGTLTLNGTGSVAIAGNNPAFTGTINLEKGQLQLDSNAGTDYFGGATLNLGKDSNAVTLQGRTNNTPAFFSSLATINVKGADVQVGGSLGSGRVFTFNGPVTFDKGANATQTFRPGTTGGVVFNGQVTLNNDVTLALGTSVSSGIFTLAKGVTQTSSVKVTNSANITLNIQGDGWTSGSSRVLTLAGAGTINVNTVMGTGSQKFEVGEGATTPAVSFTSVNSTFDGGVTLTSGTLTARGLTGTGIAGVTPVAFAGPVGRGLLKVTGGAGQLNIGGTTLYNNVEVNGGAGNAFTFDDNGTTNGTTLNGITSFRSASPMTVTFSDNNTDNIVSNAVLYQDATFTGAAGLRIGIGNDGNNRSVVFAGAGVRILQGFTAGAGTTTFTSGNFSIGSLAGSGGALVFNGPTVTAGNTGATFSNGTRLQSGLLLITANSNAGPFTAGPLGTGALELQGGTIRSDTNAHSLVNLLNVTNSFIIGDGGNGGAGLTFNNGATISNTPTITNNSTSREFIIQGGTTLNSDVTIAAAGGLTLDGLTIAADRTINFTGTGVSTLQGATSGAFNLDLTGTNQNVRIGALTGAGFNLRINNGLKVTTTSTTATYSGGTTLLGGVLIINGSSNGGFTQGPLGLGTVTFSGGNVTTGVNGGPYTVGNAIVANGNVTFDSTNDQSLSFTGALTINAAPTLTFNNNNAAAFVFSGATSLSSDVTIAGTGLAQFAGLVTVNADRTITSANSNGTGLNFKGGFTGAGNLTFAKDVAATRLVTINGGSGLSDLTGSTTIKSGVTLRSNTVNNALSANSVFIVEAGATLDVFGVGTGLGRLENIGGLSGAGLLTNGNSGTGFTTLTINVASGTQTFDGVINDGGHTLGLIKTGNGTQVLTGANTYNSASGPATTVNGGTLLANNTTGSATGSNSVLVNVGGTLGGTGSVAGAVTVASGGTIAPGGTTGTLTLGSLAMTDAAVNIELGGATPGDGSGFYDQLNVTGAINNDTSTDLVLTLTDGFTPGQGDTYFIITRGGAGTLDGTTNYFTGLAEGATFNLGDATAQITYLANWTGAVGTSTTTGGNDVAIYNVSVPEPSSMSLVFIAILGLTRRRKR